MHYSLVCVVLLLACLACVWSTHTKTLRCVLQPAATGRQTGTPARSGDWASDVKWRMPVPRNSGSPFGDAAYEVLSTALARGSNGTAPNLHAALFGQNATRVWTDKDVADVQPPDAGARDAVEAAAFRSVGAAFAHAYERPSPLCFRDGQGLQWVTSVRNYKRVRTTRVEIAMRRSLSSQGVVKLSDRVAVRNDTYAFVAMTPTPKIIPLFHLVFIHLANLLALEHIRRVYPGIRVTVYLQAFDSVDPGFQYHPEHYMRTLFNSYGDDVTFAAKFSAPRAGDVLCHARGFLGTISMSRAAEGRGFSKKNGPIAGVLVARSGYTSLLAEYGIAVSAAVPVSQRRRRLLIQQRGDVQKIDNVAEVRGWAEALGWDVSVATLEDLPAAAQVSLYAEADFVLQVHGSSLLWVLLVPPTKIVGELMPFAETDSLSLIDKFYRCPTKEFHSSFVTVNANPGLIGRIQNVGSFMHFAHACTNTSHHATPSTVDLPSWKTCSLTAPRAALEGMFGVLSDKVFAGELTPDNRTDLQLRPNNNKSSAPTVVDKWTLVKQYKCAGVKSSHPFGFSPRLR